MIFGFQGTFPSIPMFFQWASGDFQIFLFLFWRSDPSFLYPFLTTLDHFHSLTFSSIFSLFFSIFYYLTKLFIIIKKKITHLNFFLLFFFFTIIFILSLSIKHLKINNPNTRRCQSGSCNVSFQSSYTCLLLAYFSLTLVLDWEFSIEGSTSTLTLAIAFWNHVHHRFQPFAFACVSPCLDFSFLVILLNLTFLSCALGIAFSLYPLLFTLYLIPYQIWMVGVRSFHTFYH